jgi:hypothetical protein
MPQTRLTDESHADVQDALLAELLERALDAGEESVKRGPDLLPVLREARRRRRRRLRAHRHLRRRDRRAARRRAAAARAPRPGARHASPARVLDLPLLHELRGHGEDLEPTPWITRWRRSATPCSWSATAHAQGPRPHRRPERATRCSTGAARSRGSTSPTCTSRSPRAERARREDAGDRDLRRCSRSCGRGHGGAVRLARGRPLDGGPTLNPSTYELLAGIHGVPPSRSSCCRTRRTS